MSNDTRKGDVWAVTGMRRSQLFQVGAVSPATSQSFHRQYQQEQVALREQLQAHILIIQALQDEKPKL